MMASSTGGEEDLDCPICLDTMNKADATHPLQCINACGYNFCLTCIESLISSSKDDYGEASDGNMHVKVFLHCPNCRSDLGPSIRDTVLLRKADHIAECAGRGDEELTASELRMKGVMDDAEVKLAIAEARKSEADFFGKKYEEEKAGDDGAEQEDEAQYEECGVEADLLTGVHQSMRWPKQPSPQKKRADATRKRVDNTLLGGLEFAMSPSEQEVVTGLMTSGDATKLASAAQIMHGITAMTRQGKTPAQRGNRGDGRSSVFVLIDEAKKVREKSEHGSEHGRVAKQLARGGAPPPRSRGEGIVTASQHRAAELSLRRQMEFMKLYPLPVRMPKSIEVALIDPESKKFALGFCDDTWDGTVLDAWCKITISYGDKVKIKEPRNKGVFKILNMDSTDDSYNSPRIETEKPRVLVSMVKSEGGRQGVVKGDVVTHVDGEEFTGNVEDLVALVRASVGRNDHGDVLRLVLNAERSTADALRRRASVMADYSTDYSGNDSARFEGGACYCGSG